MQVESTYRQISNIRHIKMNIINAYIHNEEEIILHCIFQTKSLKPIYHNMEQDTGASG